MPPKFGTSGLRGLVTELTDALCARYTRAFLASTAHDGVLMLGGDLRPSTPRIAAAVAAGAGSLGVRVIDCGALPTPALALAAAARGAPAVMVTGSHIPADRNGLKFYTRSGEITKADEAAITAALEPDFAGGRAETEVEEGATEAYLARYAAQFGPGALAGLRVGVYEHSSVGRDVLGEALSRLGAEPVPLGRSDTFIPVDTEAVPPETRAQLADWAAGTRLDAIVSADGDADRPLVADAAGQVIPGDILGAVTAREMGAEAVVTPVSSNTMVERMDLFRRVLRTRIGSPYVIAGMEALIAEGVTRVVGYEANGGFLLGYGTAAGMAPLMTRDSLLPILATLIATKAAGGSVSGLLAGLPSRRTAADRLVGLPTETSLALVEELAASAPARQALLGRYGAEAGHDLTDGLRVRFASGLVVHLRPSGNAPELRCYAEADDAATAEAAVRDTLAAVADRTGTAAPG